MNIDGLGAGHIDALVEQGYQNILVVFTII